MSESTTKVAAQHTKGPLWVAKAGTPGERVLQVVGRRRGIPVVLATLDGAEADAEANARLYAAAPDLLDALRTVDAELRAAWNARILPADAVSAETVHDIRAAITKALNG